MITCPICKSGNEPDAKFCIKCGSKFKNGKPVNKDSPEPAAPQQIVKSKSHSKKKVFLLTSVLIIILGFLEIILWYLWDARDRLLFINYYTELKIWLWVALHGRLICGILLVLCGMVASLIPRQVFIIIESALLFTAGGWNVINDFFAIPGLKEYNHAINVDVVLRDLNFFWLLIAFVQFGLAFFYLWYHKNYIA